MHPPDPGLHARLADLPKVELHVHLEGAIQPQTLMALAAKNAIDLPPKTLAEFQDWYRFTGFAHFVEVYLAMSKCICDPDDLEHITREFLTAQAAQNIFHTEATYTALTQYQNTGMPFDEQIDAIGRAADWARAEHAVTLRLIIDIPRGFASDAEATMAAHWVADAYDSKAHGGLVAGFGLGGFEDGYPPVRYADQFRVTAEAGVPAIIHAGETGGPDSVRGAVEALDAVRIGHGIAAMRDPSVVALLKERAIVIEVCPSSNVCLGVVDSLAEHPLPDMIGAGLPVTINSDDPPFFNTTLTQEYVRIADAFAWTLDDFRAANRRAAAACLLPEADKQALADRL